jgi:hypothetical protein
MEPLSQTWKEDYVNIDAKRHPNLSQLIGEGKQVVLCVLRGIFTELLSILGNNDNSVDFTYLNIRKGHMLTIPQVKKFSFFYGASSKTEMDW